MLSSRPDPFAARPIAPLKCLCSAAEELGVPLQRTLSDCDIEAVDLDSQDAVATLDAEVRAARNALAAGVDAEVLALGAGSRASLTSLGLFGFAAMSSGSLRELLTISLRYFTLTALHVRVGLTEAEQQATITFDADHLPHDLRHFFLVVDIAAMATVVPPFTAAVFERYGDAITIGLAPEDRHLAPLLSGLSLDALRFDSTARRIDLPVQALDEPLPQDAPSTLQTCLGECEKLLDSYTRRGGVAAQVRSHILAGAMGDGGLELVAASLCVHPRTLRRQLAAEGTSYRALLEETRKAMAVELLREVRLTVEEVARRLGYGETASFTHAFTRWFGHPPTAVREPARSRR